jgi:hypothetical protein
MARGWEGEVSWGRTVRAPRAREGARGRGPETAAAGTGARELGAMAGREGLGGWDGSGAPAEGRPYRSPPYRGPQADHAYG